MRRRLSSILLLLILIIGVGTGVLMKDRIPWEEFTLWLDDLRAEITGENDEQNGDEDPERNGNDEENDRTPNDEPPGGLYTDAEEETIENPSPIQGEPTLKDPPGNVDWVEVDDSFPSSADVLNTDTLTSDAVISYFEEKYREFGGTILITVELDQRTYEEDGYKNHERTAYYRLTREEDNADIAMETFTQVYLQVALNRVADTLDGEYNRIVISSTIRQSIEEEVLQRINESRSAEGLGTLRTAGDLTRLARVKSTDMSNMDYFAHESPTYGDPFEMAGYFDVVLRAENIQWATFDLTAERIHQNFMDSPGHRDNRMHDRFTEVGIGIVKTVNGMYVTELFR